MRFLRTEAQITIDDYIKDHYPEEGPDAVAAALGKSRGYIQERAWKLKVRMNKHEREVKKKVSVKDQEIARLRAENKRLRVELLKAVHKNVKEQSA